MKTGSDPNNEFFLNNKTAEINSAVLLVTPPGIEPGFPG